MLKYINDEASIIKGSRLLQSSWLQLWIIGGIGNA